MAEAHGRFPHAPLSAPMPSRAQRDSRNLPRAAKRKRMILVGAAKRGWHEVVVYEADKYWPDYHRAYVFNWSVHGHHKNHTAVLRILGASVVLRSTRRWELGPGRGSRHVPPLRRSRLRTAATEGALHKGCIRRSSQRQRHRGPGGSHGNRRTRRPRHQAIVPTR